MKSNENIVDAAVNILESGIPLALCTIISLEGSSPRHPGTKMIVASSRKSYGTIGGSMLEADVIHEARQALKKRSSKFMDFDLTGNSDSKGMICGGKAAVLLDCIMPVKHNIELFRRWQAEVEAGRDFYFLTFIEGDDSSIKVSSHMLLLSDGELYGQSPVPETQAEELRKKLHGISQTTIVGLKDMRVLVEQVRRVKTLYCFGAGHVAVPTVQLASTVGFQAIVIDDRADYANAGRFPDADEIKVITDFNKAFEGLEIDSDSFIVILTRGHMFDREVLQQALKTRAGYIGMISSINKRDTVFQALLAEGFEEKDLKRVHSPIGLAIGAETPEEIAVSIVAELIKVRANQ
jgi:xanthine dehydrogenase accessory factor